MYPSTYIDLKGFFLRKITKYYTAQSWEKNNNIKNLNSENSSRKTVFRIEFYGELKNILIDQLILKRRKFL